MHLRHSELKQNIVKNDERSIRVDTCASTKDIELGPAATGISVDSSRLSDDSKPNDHDLFPVSPLSDKDAKLHSFLKKHFEEDARLHSFLKKHFRVS